MIAVDAVVVRAEAAQQEQQKNVDMMPTSAVNTAGKPATGVPVQAYYAHVGGGSPGLNTSSYCGQVTDIVDNKGSMGYANVMNSAASVGNTPTGWLPAQSSNQPLVSASNVRNGPVPVPVMGMSNSSGGPNSTTGVYSYLETETYPN